MQHVPPIFAAQSPHFVTGPRESLSEIDPDVPSNLSRDFKNLADKIMLIKRQETKDFEGKETGHELNRNDQEQNWRAPMYVQ